MKKANKIILFLFTLVFTLSLCVVTLSQDTVPPEQLVLDEAKPEESDERFPIKGYLERRAERTEKWTEEQMSFYFETERKCMETIVPIARKMADMRWENIYCHQVFPEKYDEWGMYITSEEEYAENSFILEGSVNGFYIVIPVIFTPEFPEGKITRVVYTGRSNWHPYEGKEIEIVDAYNVDLWKSGYCN